jgi:putative alpha-1,2-mannosidase
MRKILSVKSITPITLLLLLINMPVSAQAENDVLQYVDPFIGTTHTMLPSRWDGHGRVYPGAVAPFGFIQISPETGSKQPRRYDYSEHSIYFFSCAGHASGYPHGSAGHLLVMPLTDPAKFNPQETFRTFSKINETASPGYYSVIFDDDQTRVEATASVRTGMFRFTFQQGVVPHIYISGFGLDSDITKRTMQGSAYHSVLEFNEPYFQKLEAENGWVFTFAPSETGRREITLSLAISHVGYDGTKKNLMAENPDGDFDKVLASTRQKWHQELSVIETDDPSTQNKTKFYTALYRSMLIPWIISDVDGRYRGKDGNIYQSGGNHQYDLFSPWDTFRTLHPLHSLIAPERQNDMILSMLSQYSQTGRLPRGPMTGNHVIPILVDAYLKGINSFDKELAYQAMKEIIVSIPNSQSHLAVYDSLGYVPSYLPESVTKTVEYAYNDWVLGNFAQSAMNDSETAHLLKTRSLNYRNLFHPGEMFLLPRHNDSFTLNPGNLGYKEGDKWIYSMFVPHNPGDLINLAGGSESFVNQLDEGFNNNHFIFDNEPAFHIPYLYNYAGRPGKTQERVRSIMDENFTDQPSGLPGNDDLGSLSSWFVWSALGLYPFCPGFPVYDIGSPLFRKAIIHLPNGKTLTIHAKNLSHESYYVSSVKFNETLLQQSCISHDQLIQGGTLTFEMTHQNTDFTSQDGIISCQAEQSGNPDFIISDVSLSSTEVKPGESFFIRFTLTNKGGSGTNILPVKANDKHLTQKNFLVQQNSSINDSISCVLYEVGNHKVQLSGHNQNFDVYVQDDGNRNHFLYSNLQINPIIKTGGIQQVSFSVQNVGGHADRTFPSIRISDSLVWKGDTLLKPGEKARMKYFFPVHASGIFQVSIQDLTADYKVYSENPAATILDVAMNDILSGGILEDQSGFQNNGEIVGRKMIDNTGIPMKFDNHTYITFKKQPSLQYDGDAISIMAWIKPDSLKEHYTSLITLGDYHVLQLAGRHRVAFFTGGWGRGQCFGQLPANISGQWVHVAGVSDGKQLKIFINGELSGQEPLQLKSLTMPDMHWQLGRSEEFPNQRAFHGEMNHVKIFTEPLTENEIRVIFEREKVGLFDE